MNEIIKNIDSITVPYLSSKEILSLNSAQYVFLDIEDTVKADWNYKEDDLLTQKKLIFNLLEDGSIINVLLRKNERSELEVVDGNHRRDGIKYIKNVIIDGKNGLFDDVDEISQKELLSDDTLLDNIKLKKLVYQTYLSNKINNNDFKMILGYYMGEIPIDVAKKTAIKVNETRFESNSLKLTDIVNELYKNDGIELFNVIPFSPIDFGLMEEKVRIPLDFSNQTFSNEEVYHTESKKIIRFTISKDTYDRYILAQRFLQGEDFDDDDFLQIVFGFFLENYKKDEQK